MAKRTVSFLGKLRMLAKGIETRLKITTEGQISPIQIPNETLALCYELDNGKLVARPYKFVTPIALKLTDFPARAVWQTHIVGRLSIAFSGHPQYTDVFEGQCSLTDDQFIRVMSAQSEDIGDTMEIDEIWCCASRLVDRNAIASSFAIAMMREDRVDFKKY